MGISIGQVEVDKKSNEMKSIPELLKLIDIKDNYITINAAGTQEEAVRTIIRLEGHYILNVKANQKILMKDFLSYFNVGIGKLANIKTHITNLKKNHGREEYREYYLSYDTSCITNKDKWDTVKSIGMIRLYRKTKDKLEVNDHYYIMDTSITMEMFKKSIRNHWNIESGLHWRLDVILNEPILPNV